MHSRSGSVPGSALQVTRFGADVLRLHGGQDWQRRLEAALRQKARKVLLVASEDGVGKQGVRNEIQIAHDVGKKIDDTEFIIPLRLSSFDAPFLIAHAQYINFEKSWADGLAELLETLDVTYSVPRSDDGETQTLTYWRSVHLRHARKVCSSPETLLSNWLRLKTLPPTIAFYDFEPGINLDSAQSMIRSAPWPAVPFQRGFLACCDTADVADYFGERFPLVRVDETDTETFIENGWRIRGIQRGDAHNQFSDLVHQSLELLLGSHSLSSTEMGDGQLAWWPSTTLLSRDMIPFSWPNGLSGRRQLLGYSEARKRYWHYAITPKPRVHPFPHVRLVARVIFTSDGSKPVGDPDQMHRLRRSYTRSWRNAKWRDLMLTFLCWLSEGQEFLTLPFGQTIQAALELPPLTFDAPFSVETTKDVPGRPDEEDEDQGATDDSEGSYDDEWDELDIEHDNGEA